MPEDLRGKFVGQQNCWQQIVKLGESGRLTDEQMETLSIVVDEPAPNPNVILEISDVAEGLQVTVINGKLKSIIDP